MEKEDLQSVPGFSREIGYCLAGLREVRRQLRQAAGDLTDEETARRALPGFHSIGELLLHIGEAEWWWIQSIVSGKDKSEAGSEIGDAWDVLERSDFADKGLSAAVCIDKIDEISAGTSDVLRGIPDGDLDGFFGYERKDGIRVEKSLRWILHHLIDHEAQHKGQILLAKRLIRQRA